MPLKHTDVVAGILGYIATVDVTQQYHNPYNEKIEAVYVFPLPENAAVNEFVMTLGDRRIRGIIRERQEAEQIYRDARAQGHVASLLTQERPNVFTQKVANIEPGKQIDVNIRYFNTLAFDDGWFEFVFPLVVGPRFNSVGLSADSGGRGSRRADDASASLPSSGIGAVPRGHHGASGQPTEVQYLAPHEHTGHDVSLAVKIDAGLEIEEIASRSHVIETQRPSPESAEIRLSKSDALPNKDFILRYRLAGDRIKSALLTHRDERGGFFTIMVIPPADLARIQRRAMELIFVLDCSGSMNGRPIEQAKAAVERGLALLQPIDSFQLINFSNQASQLGTQPLQATPENIQKALRYLRGLSGEGGTMMIEGIKAALNFQHDDNRLRYVAFLTDGFIGNESEILAEIHRRLGHSRIFSFGVGSAPNRFLMDRMAKFGRGAVAYLGNGDDGGQVMEAFFKRVCRAALTDVQIDYGGLAVTDVYPGGGSGRIPDLYPGRPLLLAGRFDPARSPESTTIRISGRAGQTGGNVRLIADRGEVAPGGRVQFEVPVAPGASAFVAAGAPAGRDAREASRAFAPAALPAIWARHKIADLADRSIYEGGAEFPAEIRQIALAYGLLSDFTAFVAVDSLTQTAGTHGTTVPVAVPVPAGVRYDTTVQNDN